MRDHDDEAVLGHLLQQVHYLHARFAVQRACGLVGKKDVGVVYQRAGDRHALHLPAGHLVGFFVYLVAQAHALKDLYRPLAALLARDAGDGQRELDVCEHALVRDEVVALEHEAYRVVAVSVPVLVAVVPGRAAVYHKVAAGVLVEAADDVQQRRLPAAGGAEYGHKLTFPEINGNSPESMNGRVAGRVILCYVPQREHRDRPFIARFHTVAIITRKCE